MEDAGAGDVQRKRTAACKAIKATWSSVDKNGDGAIDTRNGELHDLLTQIGVSPRQQVSSLEEVVCEQIQYGHISQEDFIDAIMRGDFDKTLLSHSFLQVNEEEEDQARNEDYLGTKASFDGDEGTQSKRDSDTVFELLRQENEELRVARASIQREKDQLSERAGEDRQREQIERSTLIAKKDHIIQNLRTTLMERDAEIAALKLEVAEHQSHLKPKKKKMSALLFKRKGKNHSKLSQVTEEPEETAAVDSDEDSEHDYEFANSDGFTSNRPRRLTVFNSKTGPQLQQRTSNAFPPTMQPLLNSQSNSKRTSDVSTNGWGDEDDYHHLGSSNNNDNINGNDHRKPTLYSSLDLEGRINERNMSGVSESSDVQSHEYAEIDDNELEKTAIYTEAMLNRDVSSLSVPQMKARIAMLEAQLQGVTKNRRTAVVAFEERIQRLKELLERRDASRELLLKQLQRLQDKSRKGSAVSTTSLSSTNVHDHITPGKQEDQDEQTLKNSFPSSSTNSGSNLSYLLASSDGTIPLSHNPAIRGGEERRTEYVGGNEHQRLRQKCSRGYSHLGDEFSRPPTSTSITSICTMRQSPTTTHNIHQHVPSRVLDTRGKTGRQRSTSTGSGTSMESLNDLSSGHGANESFNKSTDASRYTTGINSEDPERLRAILDQYKFGVRSSDDKPYQKEEEKGGSGKEKYKAIKKMRKISHNSSVSPNATNMALQSVLSPNTSYMSSQSSTSTIKGQLATKEVATMPKNTQQQRTIHSNTNTSSDDADMHAEPRFHSRTLYIDGEGNATNDPNKRSNTNRAKRVQVTGDVATSSKSNVPSKQPVEYEYPIGFRKADVTNNNNTFRSEGNTKGKDNIAKSGYEVPVLLTQKTTRGTML
eukprot:m.181169 g.181169  ORF g.181169 m.181169 type:complete len:876 (-) comp13584_c0_seq1:619-3246(-)